MNKTEGQKTIAALMQLEDLVEALHSDRVIDDHAFWLHIDREIIEKCNRRLEKMGAAIEDERCGM
jgi:hypothetical protein